MIDISYKRCKTDVYAVTGDCFVPGWGGGMETGGQTCPGVWGLSWGLNDS